MSNEYADLRVVIREGVQCVQLDELLQILADRGNVVMTRCAMPGLDPSATELLRGRLLEINELANTLRNK